MKKINEYIPFNDKKYNIIEDNNKRFFYYHDIPLELCDQGYIPKSGLLFDYILDHNKCNNKKVLDLGCGYLGILGIISYFYGASEIDSIDYDKNCVEWFNKLIKDNNISNINCFESNYFSNINDNKLYDLILANPPQMPMLNGSLHDSGGYDGRKYILEILKNSFNHLSKDGILYLLAFDFLGVDIRYNDQPSIIEIANEIGYQNCSVVYTHEKIIKDNSVTYNNIPYINQIYPIYKFPTDEQKKCYIKILEIRR